MRGSIGDYGSHVPILAACVARAARLRPSQPILELGAGDNSTPLLHYACKGAGIPLVTLETDAKWLSRFSEYGCAGHQISEVATWTPEIVSVKNWFAEADKWSVAFVDNSPGETRHINIQALAAQASVLVVHDSETDYNTGADYKYDRIMGLFKYVSEFRRFRPYTLILSNTEPFEIEPVDKEWTP